MIRNKTTTGIVVVPHNQILAELRSDQARRAAPAYSGDHLVGCRIETASTELRPSQDHSVFLQLPDDHFIPVVVFAGDLEFKTDLGPSGLKIGELIPFLTQSKPVVLDERKMAYVIGHLEMKRSRRSLETDEYQINYVRTRVAKTLFR